MKGQSKRDGFSLVEITFGILAAAVLALTVGAMLIYGYGGWRRCKAEAELERDGAVALRTLDWTLRGAVLSGIVTTNSGEVTFRTTNGVVAKFYQDASDLRYDNDIATGGTDAYVITNLVSPGGFVCVPNGVNSVNITLKIADLVTHELNAVVFPRN